jgi:hypothetical protein
MPVFPSIAATEPTSISGADVAIPTIVMPIIKGDMPNMRDMLAAPETNRSAPNISNISPATISKLYRNIS